MCNGFLYLLNISVLSILNWIPFFSFRVRTVPVALHVSIVGVNLASVSTGRASCYCGAHCTNQPSVRKGLMATHSHPSTSPVHTLRHTSAYCHMFKYGLFFNLGGKDFFAVSASKTSPEVFRYTAFIVNCVVQS